MPTDTDSSRSKLQRVRHSIASRGLFRTVADVATLLLAYHPERDHSFDRAFGTDTAGSVPTSRLGIDDPEMRASAILYLPSPPRVTRWMLNHIGVRYRDFAFVDLGCGKGRVILVASEYPFKEVIGVEISSELSAIARSNSARYQPPKRQGTPIRVENVDATSFGFPTTNLVLHLYHPFESFVTAAVLSKLQESLVTTPRHVVVAYLTYESASAAVRDVFAGFPWLRMDRHEQSVLGHYDWLIYSNRRPPGTESE